MTANNGPNGSILSVARSDPVGAGLIISACALVALVCLYVWTPPALEPVFDRLPWRVVPHGPREWRGSARPGDALIVPNYHVSYWGDPKASYGIEATKNARRPIAIIVHNTQASSLMNVVKYGHRHDANRGGSYGYHIYIDRAGRIVQGAPMSRRTNHIKPRGHSARRMTATNLDSANTISVAAINACDGMFRTKSIVDRCSAENLTTAQLEAGVAVVKAMMRRYGIDCGSVYGHGDLQTDREQGEGAMIRDRIRQECAVASR